MAAKTPRAARIAKIHIAKNRLALEDESYRALLRRVTGKDSSTDCTEAQLDAVLQEFVRLGFTDKKKPFRRSEKAYVRMIWAIWGDLAPYVAGHSDEALRGFVRRQTKTEARPEGVSAPEFLNPEDGNRVIEGLKAWLRRERAAAQAARKAAAQ